VIERLLLLFLFLIGFYGLVGKKNIIKKIFGLTILNSTVVILFVLEGSRSGVFSPILAEGIVSVVDPVPQALMLTAIVIGVCVTALALAMAYRLFRTTHTFDIDKIHSHIHGGVSGEASLQKRDNS